MLRLSGASQHAARALRIATLTEAATKRVVAWGLQHSPPCREAFPRRFGSAAPQWQQAALAADAPSQSPLPAPSEPSAYDFAKALPIVCPGCGGMSQTVDPDVAGFYSPKKRNLKKGKDEKKQLEDEIFEQAMARLSPEDQTLLPSNAEPENVENDKPLLCDRCHNLIYQSKGESILHPSMESIRDIIESSPHRDNHIYHVIDAADFPMSLIPNLISTLDLPRLRTQNRRSKSRNFIHGRKADVSFIITRSDLLAPQKEDVDRLMPYLQEVLRDALGRAGRNLRLGNVRCVSAQRGWWTPHVKEEIWKRGGAGWVVGKVNVGKSALFEVAYPKGRNIKPNAQAQLAKVKQRGELDVAVPEQGENGFVGIGDTFLGIGDSILDAAEWRLEEASPVQSEAFSDSDSTPASTSLEADGEATIETSAQQDDALKTEGQRSEEQDEVSQSRPEEDDMDEEFDDAEISLLPPAQMETAYPHMPIVSSLPGTTASPIRIPYGNGKGELIDLPGIQRSSLETHIKPEHRSSLIMKSRVVPEQVTLRAGRSLLIGGIIRITPKTDDLIFLAYPFTPLTPHAARNDKAIAIQTGFSEDGTSYSGTVENIGTESAKKRIKSAGTFKIQWDATSKRTGSLTDRTAGKRKVSDLPFIVHSADILIESVGWVEIAVQVRARKKKKEKEKEKQTPPVDALSEHLGIEGEDRYLQQKAELQQHDEGGVKEKEEDEDEFPEVEVFSPKGKYIAIRQPMNAWITGGPKKVAKHAVKTRPRMSISYQRRMEGGRRGGQRQAGGE
ncbi:hypothetical protein BST61_g4275 [Cercospora zeina]